MVQIISKEFIKLADSIKLRLESRFSKDQLNKIYVYDTLIELISKYHSGTFGACKTDIGIAAVKLFDSNSEENNRLVSDLVKLAQFYKSGCT